MPVTAAPVPPVPRALETFEDTERALRMVLFYLDQLRQHIDRELTALDARVTALEGP